MIRRGSALAVVWVAALAVGCVSNPPIPASGPARYPAYQMPDVPDSVPSSPSARVRYEAAWQRFQAGDVRGAGREFGELLRQAPGFYPAEAALGFVALAGQQAKQAAARFAAVTSQDERYLPAWLGLVEADLALGDDEAAAAALEHILALDPSRDTERTRLELLRFRQVQALIESGRAARLAGRLDDAERALRRALALSPHGALVLRELAWTKASAGAFAEAEAFARDAIAIDGNDAEALAVLGKALDGLGRARDAANAYRRAAAIDPRWKADADALRDRAAEADLPAEFRDVATAKTVTRGQVAAVVGMRLSSVLQRARVRPPQVATDVREHWAASWILQVTQAGIMDLFPNHTFQPGVMVRRADLADVVARLAAVGLAGRPAELARLQALQPRFADLPATHLSYRAAALAVATGAMTVGSGDRFRATEAASGPELLVAVERIEQLMIR